MYWFLSFLSPSLPHLSPPLPLSSFPPSLPPPPSLPLPPSPSLLPSFSLFIPPSLLPLFSLLVSPYPPPPPPSLPAFLNLNFLLPPLSIDKNLTVWRRLSWTPYSSP